MARIAHGALSLMTPPIALVARDLADQASAQNDAPENDVAREEDAVDWFPSAARGVDVSGWFASFVDDPGERRTPPVSEVVPALAPDDDEEYKSEALVRDLRARGLL